MGLNKIPEMKMTIMIMIFLLQYNYSIVAHMHWGLDWRLYIEYLQELMTII